MSTAEKIFCLGRVQLNSAKEQLLGLKNSHSVNTGIQERQECFAKIVICILLFISFIHLFLCVYSSLLLSAWWNRPMVLKNLCSNPPNLLFGSNSDRGEQPWLFGRLFWHHSILKLFPKEGRKRAYGKKHGVTDEHVIAPMAVTLSQGICSFYY